MHIFDAANGKMRERRAPDERKDKDRILIFIAGKFLIEEIKHLIKIFSLCGGAVKLSGL